MPQHFRKTRPDIYTSRVAWERSWEEDFKAVYHPDNIEHVSHESHLPLRVPPGNRGAELLNEISLSLYDKVHYICKSQKILARHAALSFARTDFENRWRSSPDEKRRETILEGICRTMCSGPDMDRKRELCPDSTLSHLASREGRTYIEMLKTVLPTDLDAPITEPVHFPHPAIDYVLFLSSEDQHKLELAAMMRMDRLWRTDCLTSIIHNILLAFCGQHQEMYIVKPPRVKPVDIGGDSTSKSFGRLLTAGRKEQRAVRKLEQSINACRACTRHGRMLVDGKKLMACSQCRKVGRNVWYCSSECQIEDWKNGLARPHKYICGRLLGREDMAVLSQAQDRPAPGPQQGDAKSRPGYTPSPALLYQMSLLSHDSNIDYFFFPPYPAPGIGMVLDDAKDTAHVRQHREKAFSSGDPQSITMIYRVIVNDSGFKSSGIQPVHLQKQLEREFGLTLETSEIYSSSPLED